MKYQVSQKIMAMGGDYVVRNESGDEVFYFDGQVFNFGGKKVRVLDSRRNEVARIVRKLFTFQPHYHFKRNGRNAATIRRRGFSVRDKFVIKLLDSTNYEIVGDYIGHEYTINRGSESVARVSKKFFGSTDSYGVDIQKGEPILILSAVVVIDMVLFKKLKTR